MENIQDAIRAAHSGEDADEKRERSTIQFPYNDLDDAVSIAKAVHENAGLFCTIEQLAAYVKNSLTSGAFRLRVSNASTFGLTENARGEVRLTPLGRRVADSSQEAAAKIDAFLAVALYARIFDNYNGFTLPGPAALEKFMREVGVSGKQTGKARQALCAQRGKLDFLRRETIDWYGLLALEQNPLARKVMGANRTSQRKTAPEAMMEAAERFLRRSIQSSWGFWLASQKLGMSGGRASERFGLSF